MSDWKTSFIYKDGLNIASQPIVHGSAPMLSFLGGIDLAMQHLPSKYRINGIIFISYEGRVLTIEFDIEPKEAVPILQQAIIDKHTRLKEEGRLKLYP